MRRILHVAALLACALATCRPLLAADEASIVAPSQIIEYEPQTLTDRAPVITAVAVLSGGGMVATAGDDHVVRIWSTTTGRVVHTLKGHLDWVRTLAFSPDGTVLASAGDDRQIMLWDAVAGKLLLRTPPVPHALYCVAFNPEGSRLAAVGFDHEVYLYDPANGALRAQARRARR